MADDFVPKLRAERDGARLREMRLATKLDDCVEILEHRERQIERVRRAVAVHLEIACTGPVECEHPIAHFARDVLAALGDPDASETRDYPDANKTQVEQDST